jgi:hypothetical protein
LVVGWRDADAEVGGYEPDQVQPLAGARFEVDYAERGEVVQVAPQLLCKPGP